LDQAVEALDVKVWRGNAKGGSYRSYEVPAQQSQTVLDVVTWIQQNAEPTLTYRFACRVGMCGSCAMMVNGEPRWTCRTHVKKVLEGRHLEIAPLRNLPVIKDLATDMAAFFDKWTGAEGVFHPTATRADAIAMISPEEPARVLANEAIECINCAVCYAACDTVTANPDYLGPAALNRAWTLQNDERDGAHSKRLRTISKGGGCFNCHSHQSCMTYCPNELNPTASIAGLKRLSSTSFFKGGRDR
jgi:succinate dehydrogenase iron-sulfur subunit